MSSQSPVFSKASASAIPRIHQEEALFKTLFILAGLSLFGTLNLPYQGEEALYTLTSLEMWFHQEWIKPLLYGESYGRPPLLNWFIIPLASFLGWEQVLIVSRLVTATATLSSSLILVWLSQQLFHHKTLAWFAAILFLSGDLLFRRGWLAYSDPVFSLFVFSSIAFLWVGLEKKRTELMALANLCLIAAFLSKALTAYSFYGIAFLVFFWRHENRRFLFSPLCIIFQIFSLLFPLIWNVVLSKGAHGSSMVIDVLSKLSASEFQNYFLKTLSYPFYTFIYWLPGSGLLAFLFWKSRKAGFHFLAHLKHYPRSFTIINLAFWILLLNYLPYWLAPQNRIRYILPLYPIFVLLTSYMLYQAGEKMVRLSYLLLGGLMLVKFIFVVYGYTFFEKQIHGDYLKTAQDILQKTQAYPLYIEDDTANGLSVAAQIDILRLTKAPLKRYPALRNSKLSNDAFYLLGNMAEHPETTLFQEYTLGRHKLYLMCRGKACQKTTNDGKPGAPV